MTDAGNVIIPKTTDLGGILFQEESLIRRGVPLLSDIPLLGALFSHEEGQTTNNEMLVFITPYVIDNFEDLNPETKEQIEIPKEKLKNILEQLSTSTGKLN